MSIQNIQIKEEEISEIYLSLSQNIILDSSKQRF